MTNVISDWWTRNLPYFLVQASDALIKYWLLFKSCSLYFCIFSGRFATNVLISANHPSCFVYKKTIPHRETVAGDATARSSTSNIIVIQDVNLIIYPLVKQSFLLSSSTVFMFSIQTASTGPSKTIHFLSFTSAYSAHFLIRIATTPSVQDFVLGSSLPYSWSDVIDLGLSLSCWTLNRMLGMN